jgi:hypothetical protein
MTPMHISLKLALLGAFLAGVTVLARGPSAARMVAPPRAGTTTGVGASNRVQSVIRGTAVDRNERPVPNAAVRLRNLQTNQIEQVSTANSLGEFLFVAQPEMPYVVELADRAGEIVAVGDVITMQAGEVAGAVVVFPSQLPAVAGFFGDTASSVMSAATSTGLTAVQATDAPLVSPES